MSKGGDEMVNRAFQYDLISEKWVECTNENFINADIEKLPSVVIVKYDWKRDENFLFCPKHKQVEKIIFRDEFEIISEQNCKFSGLKAVVKISRNEFENSCREIHDVPIRWRIFQNSADSPINIAADIVRLYYHGWHNIFLKHYENYFINVSIKKKIFVTNIAKSEIKIPEIVTDLAMEFLQESTKAVYGFKPTVITKFEGKEKILAYIERPFDLNIILLKYFFADFVEFDKIFPYECTDNYKIICRLLEINPPKSLRKAYAKNPYAIIWYMIFKQLGVQDVNFMQKFFPLDDCIANMYLSKFYFNTKTKKVSRIEYRKKWLALEYFCKCMLNNKGEKFFMNWLYKFSTKENLTQNQIDTIEMFYKYEDKISAEIKARLWKDGLTNYIHDMISWQVRESLNHLENVRVIFTPEILEYEAIINGYEFKIVRDTKTLYFVSLELENCVMSYRDKFLKQESIIVVVIKNKKYLACIEIQDKIKVVQALGVHNQRLEGELLFVFEIWTAWKNLIDYSEHNSTPIIQCENVEPYTDLGKFVGSLIVKARTDLSGRD